MMNSCGGIGEGETEWDIFGQLGGQMVLGFRMARVTRAFFEIRDVVKYDLWTIVNHMWVCTSAGGRAGRLVNDETM